MQRRTALQRLIQSSGAAAASIAWPTWAQSRPLVLGQSAAFSGPAAQLGIQMHRGAKIHFDSLNANGGINGQQVELRTLDDGYEPDRCKANTEQFIKSDVFALFGYVGTPTCVAALPLVNEARIPFFGPFTGAEVLRDPFSRWVFHVRASYYDETALIVRHLTHLGLKRIAVFYQNDSYGMAGLTGVKRALAALKLEPVALGTVERNTVDVTRAVADIVAKMPEAVVQISAYKSCAAFIRAARRAGYGAMVINVSFVGTQALADELGKEARGVMVSQVMPYPFSTTTGISREYLDAVRKAGPEVKPNYSSMEGFVAAKVLAEGIRRAGRNPTRDALVTGLESIRNTSFGGFNVDFGAQKHVASTYVDLSVLTEDGKVIR
jgi:ABC-type branched-subunit amino acid transport system substrate-binding protein